MTQTPFQPSRVTLDLPDAARRVVVSLPKLVPEAQPAAAGGEEIQSPEALGRLVRGVRERRNQSQQNFADLAGVGRRFVSELENGKATLELGKVLKVARAAGISILARER